MTPIIKSYLTDDGYFSTDQALQSMGGSGFTQDWEVEQLLRDGRIARIYEGTNGIQALDLVGRKLMLKGGRLPRTYFAKMNQMIAELHNEDHVKHCKALLSTLQESLMWLAAHASKDPEEAGAAATPMLKLFALTSMAVMWATMANVAGSKKGDGAYTEAFYDGKLKAADHFFRVAHAQAAFFKADVEGGKSTLMAFAEDEF